MKTRSIKKNKSQTPSRRIEPQSQEDTYSVKSSFRKIGKYTRNNSTSRRTEDNVFTSSSRVYKVDDRLTPNWQTEATPYISSYNRLDEKIETLTQTNISEHNSLRRELEQKQAQGMSEIVNQISNIKEMIDKKMEKTNWGLIVTIIFAIIGAFAVLSYYPLLNETKVNRMKLNKLNLEVETIKLDIKHTTEIDSIRTKPNGSVVKQNKDGI